MSSMIELQEWLRANCELNLLVVKLALPTLHSSGTKLECEPPIRLPNVASSLWPVALRRQLELV